MTSLVFVIKATKQQPDGAIGSLFADDELPPSAKPVDLSKLKLKVTRPTAALTLAGLFDETLHPRAGEGATLMNPETGQIIRGGQFAPSFNGKTKNHGTRRSSRTEVSGESEGESSGSVRGSAGKRKTPGDRGEPGDALRGSGSLFDQGERDASVGSTGGGSQGFPTDTGSGASAGPSGERSARAEPDVTADQDVNPDGVLGAAEAAEIERERLGIDEADLTGADVADVQTGAHTISAPLKTGLDYRITSDDRIGQGGFRQKFADNLEAIRVLKTIEAEQRPATAEEQARLVKYTGWGWSGNLFNATNEYPGRPMHKEYRALQDILTPDEFRSAAGSIKNSHFTAPEVVSAIWDGVRQLGFTGGRVLEPSAGIGHFFGLMPADIAARSTCAAVELDSLTSRICAQLYQNADVKNCGFEETSYVGNENELLRHNLPDEYFDLAISNVPFGDYGVADPQFDRQGKKYLTHRIHNYFFAKALEKVRPGGLVAFVTSTGTMDAKSYQRFREYLSSKADLLGAFRLPNDSFKENAGTEVTTDVIYLRKRLAGDKPDGHDWSATQQFPISDGTTVTANEYYARRPNAILGTAVRNHMIRGDEDRMAVQSGDRLIDDAMATAQQAMLPTGVYRDRSDGTDATKPDKQYEFVPLPDFVKLHGYGIQGDRLMVRTPAGMRDAVFALDEDGKRALDASGQPVRAMSVMAEKRCRGMVEIRDRLRDLHRTMLSPHSTDEEVRAGQKALRLAYNNFQQAFGNIHATANMRAFASDPDLALLCSLERYDSATKEVTPSDVFTTRTILPVKEPTHAGSAPEAMLHSLNQRGNINWQYMEGLTGKTPAELQAHLLESGHVFRNPCGDFEDRSTYLSGNVREKLRQAQAASKLDPSYGRNVDELRQVQPQDLGPADIDVHLGAGWVPPKYVQDFMCHLLQIPDYDNGRKTKVDYLPAIARWITSDPGYPYIGNAANNELWGTPDVPAHELITLALNSGRPRVMMDSPTETNEYGKPKRVTNIPATEAAEEKMSKIRDAFSTWVFQDEKRTDELCGIYNEQYNCDVDRHFDGSHLTLPGLSEACRGRLNDHVKDAVYRQLASPSTLLAHAVGAGKAQPLDAKVMTPTGWRLMGDLRVGDQVISANGKPTVIVGVYPQGQKEIFRVTMSDGSSTECCDEHLWLTWTYQERTSSKAPLANGRFGTSTGHPHVRALSDIRATLIGRLGAKNHSIPIVHPVQMEASATALPPYLLGLLLGDGGMTKSHSLTFTSTDDELILAAVEMCAPLNVVLKQCAGDKISYTLVDSRPLRGVPKGERNLVVGALRRYGLQGKGSVDKFIPDEFKYNSPDVRLAVLQGLMDTDGTVDGRSGRRVTFSTISKRLADDVTFLVRSLGGTTSVSTKSLYTGNIGYTLALCLPPDIAPFRLRRKATLVVPKTKYQPVRYIVSVEPVGLKDAQCIAVTDPSHLYVTDDFIVTHNTWSIACAAMEKRRLGNSTKPMIAVPNHLVGQWATEIQELYPGAKVLMATKKDMEKSRRREFLSKIQNGDWDMIVIAHSQFGRIPVSLEREQRYYHEQLDILHDYLRSAAEEHAGAGKRGRSDSEKAIQGAIKRLEDKLKKRIDERKANTDDFVNFENLGVDSLFIDEFHVYKNLEFASKLSRIKGLPQGGSQRALDMYLKVKHMLQHNPLGGVTAATGTPVANSLAELFTMQRYLDEPELARRGLNHFDAWKNNHATTKRDLEATATGDLKQVERLAQFTNLPELSRMFHRFGDVILPDQLHVERPDAERVAVPCSMSPEQEDYIHQLARRAEALTGPDRPDPHEDNMLKITSEGRKNSLDQRLINPSLPDHPDSKINNLVRTIKKEWVASHSIRGTQTVFMDMGTPKTADTAEQVEDEPAGWEDLGPDELREARAERFIKSKKAEMQHFARTYHDYETAQRVVRELPDDAPDETRKTALAAAGVAGTALHTASHAMLLGKNPTQKRQVMRQVVEALKDIHGLGDESEEEQTMRSSLYQQIKEKLIAEGIPAEQIAFIHDANTEPKKIQLFKDVNDGTVRVLLGSTEKMGTGMNAQKRMCALHHMDCPWRPADLEQREGRIIRKGNLNKLVRLYNYITQGTDNTASFDTYLWQLIRSKQSTIDQVMSGDPTVRRAEDIGDAVMHASQMIAIGYNNPYMHERNDLQAKIARLGRLHSEHLRSQYSARNALKKLPSEIADLEKRLDQHWEAIAHRDTNAPPKGEDRITVGGRVFDKAKEGMDALRGASQTLDPGGLGKELGTFNGFRVHAQRPPDRDLLPQPAEFTLSHDLERARRGDAWSAHVEERDSTQGQLQRFRNVLADLSANVMHNERSLASARQSKVDYEKHLAPFEKQEELDRLKARLAEVEHALGTHKDENVATAGLDTGDSVEKADSPFAGRFERTAGKWSGNSHSANVLDHWKQQLGAGSSGVPGLRGVLKDIGGEYRSGGQIAQDHPGYGASVHRLAVPQSAAAAAHLSNHLVGHGFDVHEVRRLKDRALTSVGSGIPDGQLAHTTPLERHRVLATNRATGETHEFHIDSRPWMEKHPTAARTIHHEAQATPVAPPSTPNPTAPTPPTASAAPSSGHFGGLDIAGISKKFGLQTHDHQTEVGEDGTVHHAVLMTHSRPAAAIDRVYKHLQGQGVPLSSVNYRRTKVDDRLKHLYTFSAADHLGHHWHFHVIRPREEASSAVPKFHIPKPGSKFGHVYRPKV